MSASAQHGKQRLCWREDTDIKHKDPTIDFGRRNSAVIHIGNLHYNDDGERPEGGNDVRSTYVLTP